MRNSLACRSVPCALGLVGLIALLGIGWSGCHAPAQRLHVGKHRADREWTEAATGQPAQFVAPVGVVTTVSTCASGSEPRAVIAVAGSGQLPLADRGGCEFPGLHPMPTDDDESPRCATVNMAAVSNAIAARLQREIDPDAQRIAVGACARVASPKAGPQVRHAGIRINDWGNSSRAAAIVAQELAHWNVGDTFYISLYQEHRLVID